MAKKKKVTLGSVCKSKEGNGTYIKIYKDHFLKDGMNIIVETPQEELKGAQKACADGKISSDILAQIEERIAKYPPYVKSNLIYFKEEA